MSPLFQNLKDRAGAAQKDPVARSLYRRALGFLLVMAVILSAVAVYRYWSVAEEARRREADIAAGPKVVAVPTAASVSEKNISFQGETRPYASVTLYAKLSGYLSAVKVDKGDLVEKDQVLAIINSPETSKDYRAALADSQNKRGIASRMRQLRRQNLVSPQETDQATSDADIAEAKLEAVAVQKGYELLRAPFAGTVTARFVDPGMLVQNAMASQTSAQPVVTVSQTKRLRIYVYVDQKYAYFIQKSDPAMISLVERPEVKLQASVTRLSGELDSRTRMMLVEVEMDNTKGEIVAGSFVQVSLKVKMPVFPEIPVEAVVIRENKSMVPVIDQAGLLHYRAVELGDNDGQRVKVFSGLKDGELVALNLGNSLAEGAHVRVISSEGIALKSK